MQDLPLPFADDGLDAANFIGALTYFETSDVLRELCRIVRRGGHIVLSQRDDLMRDGDFEHDLEDLEHDRVWRRVFGAEPTPYLPHHSAHGQDIRVQYFVYRVT